MKDSSCCKQNGLSTMFHPTLVSMVVGVIMMTAGAGKFIGGAVTMSYLGTAVLSVFLSDASVANLAALALILGYIAASIELLWWFAFAVGYKKTRKYAAFALAVVILFALSTKFGKIEGLSELSPFQAFSKVLSAIRLDLLLAAIFIQKSLGIFGCCKKSCCGTVEKSCCGSGKCEK